MRNRQKQFWRGLRTGAPVILGYFPVSFSFAAAITGGLSWQLTVLISATNFTSAGQMAGAGLLLGGAALTEIGATVLFINLRYTLMSLSLSQKTQTMSVPCRLLLACGITDEIYFLASREKGEIDGAFFTGLAIGPYLSWTSGTLVGALAGQILPTFLTSALGIALYAMFIAIIVPPMRESRAVTLTVAVAVGMACLFRYLPGLNDLPDGWVLIFCALIASMLAAWRFPITEEEEAA